MKKVFTDEPVVQKTGTDKTKGLFVSVGDSGTILTSSDGTTWTQKNKTEFAELKKKNQAPGFLGVTYGNGIFVAVANEKYTSSDGISWAVSQNSDHSYLNGVTYGNGLFVTVGDSGTVLTSSDGNSWTERNSGTSNTLRGVTYGNGLFVTMDTSGNIVTSSDGTYWTERDSGTSVDLRDVTYGNGLFVTVGQSNIIFTSPDGDSWTKSLPIPSFRRPLLGVTYSQ